MFGFGWEIIAVLGTFVLGAAIAYGVYQYSHRNRANDPVREAATREQYEHPDRYEQETKPALDKQIRPS